MKTLHIAIACGGTGGHLFPGLATAEPLRADGHEVSLWLSGRDVESSVRGHWPGPVVTVRSAGMPRDRMLGAMCKGAGLIAAAARARRVMAEKRPDVVLAMGGYASVPPVLAARSLGIPAVLHEANAVPGRAVRFLNRFADAVALAFAEAAIFFRSGRTIVTGLPIRDALLPSDETRPPERGLHVLVMGGSQGAHALNDIVPEGICRARAAGQSDVRVTHLTGARDAEAVRARYAAGGVEATVDPFCSDMRRVYGGAHMAFARSGASSCIELAQWRIPAVLVPLPHAPGDHQAANAAVLEKAGAARLVRQAELNPAHVMRLLKEFRSGGFSRGEPWEGFDASLHRTAARHLADVVLNVVK